MEAGFTLKYPFRQEKSMNDQTYDLKSIKLPRFAGFSLRLFVSLIESPVTRWMLIGQLLKQGGITRLRELQLEDAPTYLPLYSSAGPFRRTPSSLRDLAKQRPGKRSSSSFTFPSIADYASAYKKKTASPVDVAERVIEAIQASNAGTPALRAIIASNADDIRSQARESARRIQAGKPRSILEGVPIAVKDEVDALPYPTKVGTQFLGESAAAQDATVVARLRAAGALIIGKANMHEIGIGVTGNNPHHGTPRNPYAPDHYTGGSSSGPASATAAGLCPAAVGADGGGSIRIPSSFCGLVGLKTTFGRTSTFGGAPLTWSNDQYGPLAGSVTDAAILYTLMSGPDPRDPNTLGQPPLSLDGFDKTDLKGLTLGVYWPWFEHAAPEVVTTCKQMLAALQARGAKVKEVTIPELDAARIGHLVTITSEMLSGLAPYAKKNWKDYSLEVRTNLDLALAFTSQDYLKALRIRTRSMVNFNRVLAEVDAIVTPTTACVAPPIPADALSAGESDLTTLLEIMRFAPPANFTGLPAISFPAGYTADGLPIGFQAMGRPWHEHVLLRVAHVAEGLVERKAPRVLFNLLS
jgi:Asp-tRNA(Asn)/Glu-tRNA(Gln) amidotransferase A subunit family amidase